MATLDDFIRELETLDQNLKTQVGVRAAAKIEREIRRSTAAGQTPYGQAWPANRDGSRPLVGIDKYVSVRPAGNGVSVSLSDPATYHNTGTSTLPRRQILPNLGDLPETWQNALNEAVKEVIDGSIVLGERG